MNMSESCITYEWVMSHIWVNCVMYEWVVNDHLCAYDSLGPVYKWIVYWNRDHDTHVNESCKFLHHTHMNESCHTYEWVMSKIWTSHVKHIGESCHTYGWVISHIWVSHVTHINESRTSTFARTIPSITPTIGSCLQERLTKETMTHTWMSRVNFYLFAHDSFEHAYTRVVFAMGIYKKDHETHVNESCEFLPLCARFLQARLQ